MCSFEGVFYGVDVSELGQYAYYNEIEVKNDVVPALCRKFLSN